MPRTSQELTVWCPVRQPPLRRATVKLCARESSAPNLELGRWKQLIIWRRRRPLLVRDQGRPQGGPVWSQSFGIGGKGAPRRL